MAINRLGPVYEPGRRCVYTSGTGYDTLGQILVATDPGQRVFRQIAREDLFAPLGLNDTSFGLPTADPARVPVSFAPGAATPAAAVMAADFNRDL
jgi:CubicO group peptidase (beta-lactamase class C family)